MASQRIRIIVDVEIDPAKVDMTTDAGRLPGASPAAVLSETVFDFLASDPEDLFPAITVVDNFYTEALD